MNLLAAELVKLKTIRATWGYAIAALGFGGLLAAAGIGGVEARERLEPGYQTTLALDSAFPAVVLGLLLGMLLFTNEFRHGTISRTLLVTPRRSLLVVLKLITGAIAGLGLAVLSFVVTAITAVIWLGVLDISLELGDAADGLWRGLLGAALIGALGAAVGGFVHSQVAALVGTLVWLFVAEPIVWVLLGLVDLDGVTEYLPGVTVLSIADTEGENLSYAGTVGMALVWIAAATALALYRTRRKDIT